MKELKVAELKTLLSREELRRLEKAARDKNKEKIIDWAKQFEYQVSKEYRKYYEDAYIDILGESIDNFILTVIYTLHFNERTKFGNKRIDDFMEDLFETIDMFRREEALPSDYRKQLEEDGITIKKKEEE